MALFGCWGSAAAAAAESVQALLPAVHDPWPAVAVAVAAAAVAVAAEAAATA